jgi:hypothetical protein
MTSSIWGSRPSGPEITPNKRQGASSTTKKKGRKIFYCADSSIPSVGSENLKSTPKRTPIRELG